MKTFRKRAALITLQVIRSRGFFALLKMVINHLVGERPLQGFEEIKAYFHGKNCREIGGPSLIFQAKSILPIYGEVKSIDNCTFSSKTFWEAKTHPLHHINLRLLDKDASWRHSSCFTLDKKLLVERF